MVSGVVALLDTESTAQIEAIWQEFQSTFGVHGVSRTPIAHFSFHVAESYDAVQTIPTIEALAQQTTPFSVRTAGLGLFTGTLPVLHVAVVRNAHLSQMHSQIWEALTPLAAGIETYYHPDHWQPHVTIAQGDIPPEKLPEVIALLQARRFNWEIDITQFGFIADSGSRQPHELRQVFPLRGKSHIPPGCIEV